LTEEVEGRTPLLPARPPHRHQDGFTSRSWTRQRYRQIQLLGGELAQLIVDQRQELLGRMRVTGFDAGEDLCDFVLSFQEKRASGWAFRSR
jgi:hypothetical protein